MNIHWLGVLGWSSFDKASIDHLKRNYKRFDEWRYSLENKKYVPFYIKQKMILLVHNILDFENVTLGITIQKREKYIEKAKEVFNQEFEMCYYITYLILELMYHPKVFRYDDTYSYLLDIGIVYSQILQSYADTLDELTND